MTTYQFGDITLEEFKPREWRAWRRLEENVPLETGDEIQLNGSWVLANWTRRGTGEHYRRPVPLPSFKQIIFGSAKMEDDCCSYFHHPTNGMRTQSITLAESWLRTLLPGYEEQLAKVKPSQLDEMFTAEEQAQMKCLKPGFIADLIAKVDSPVPADGWRPWHHSVKYVTRVKKMPVDRWVDRDEFDTEEEARADLAFVAPLLPSLKCHIVRREVTEHVLEPLPPPPTKED